MPAITVLSLDAYHTRALPLALHALVRCHPLTFQ